MIIASVAMITAGIVEVFRQKSCCGTIMKSNFFDSLFCIVDRPISIFSQLPQYFFMGVAELFFNLASLEFAYLAAPNTASSLVMSLRYCSLGLSSFVGFGYVEIYERGKDSFKFSVRISSLITIVFIFIDFLFSVTIKAMTMIIDYTLISLF